MGQKIVFYSQTGQESYEETIDMVYPTGFTISIKEPDHWNLNGSKSYGIDSTYGWEANVKGFGKTINTIYVDIVVYSTRLETDTVMGSTIIRVPDYSLFVQGDLVELFDSSGTVQITEVISISDFIVIADPAIKLFSVPGASRIERLLMDMNISLEMAKCISYSEIYNCWI